MFKVIFVFLGAFALGLNARELGFGSINGFLRNVNPKVSLPLPRIVGGQDSTLDQFPHQASLQIRGVFNFGHFCGGSLISASWIMTAGHCVTEVQVPAFHHVQALVGIRSLKEEGPNVQSRKVVESIVHEQYVGGVAPYDIALLRLEEPFQLNEHVSIISLPVSDEDPTGTATLSGWGSISTTTNPSYPDILQYADLPLISYADCETGLGVDSPLSKATNICTGDASQTLSACSGDSGGPLIQTGADNKPQVIGIVSWGQIPCGQAPSVYTRVSKFVDWIAKQQNSYYNSAQ